MSAQFNGIGGNVKAACCAMLLAAAQAHAQDVGVAQSTESSDAALLSVAVANQGDEVESPPKIAPAGSKNRLIEEIIVTAQKREENLLEVPISITAFSADKLDAQGVVTADDLARVTPGMTFTKVAGFSLVYIRGIGTDAFLPGADQSVPQYVDGINILAGQGVQNTLGRVERVEVLKGPQGTLFGRNSTGGAINIVTPDPSDTFFGDASIEIGNFNAFNQKVFVNLPVVDGLAAAVSAFNQQSDEYYKNASGPIIKRPYQRGAQGKIKWSPIDDFHITFGAQYTEARATGSLLTENTRPTPILGAPIQTDEADRIAHQDVLGGSSIKSSLVSATAVANLDWLDVKLIASDQSVKMPFNEYDFDMSPLPLISFSVPHQRADQKTAELQFLSNSDTPYSDVFEWVAGLYYLDGEGGFYELDLHIAQQGLLTILPGTAGKTLQDLLNAQLLAIGLPALLAGHTNAVAGGVIASNSKSAYAQGTLHMTDTLDLTLGARYQKESRSVFGSRFGLLNPLNGDPIEVLHFNPPELDTTQFSPRMAFQWKPSDDINVYTSFARGYQSPTYNAVNFFSSPDPVKEVKVDAYELGIKARIPDMALSFESAVFYTDETNITSASVSLTSGGVARFDNVGSARIKGIEGSATWIPLQDLDPGLAVTVGATYLDAEYTDYKNGRGFDDATGLSFGDGTLLPLLPARDFTGNDITRTPKLTYTVGINQNIPVSTGWFEVALDTYYNSGFYFLPQNTDLYKQGSYRLLNGSVSYFYEPWRLLLVAYGQNLTDESYTDSMFVVDFGRGEHLNAPRTYGVRLKLEF